MHSSVVILLGALAIPALLHLQLQISSVLVSPFGKGDSTNYEEGLPFVFIFPFVGLSLLPVVILAWKFVFKTNSITKIVGTLLTIFYFLHNFLTIIYGNVNNDAYSNSWMIDVSAPTSYWNEFKYLDSSFKLSTNTSLWHKAIDGPHMDDPLTCNGHFFTRFMFHRIRSEARAAKVLGDGTVFCGVWSIVQPVYGDTSRAKVYTDFASGDDYPFNGILIPKFLVDVHNGYTSFQKSFDDEEGVYDITGADPFYNAPMRMHAKTTEKVYPPGGRNHLQNQFSCMTESSMLRSVTGQGWCFYKMMKADTDVEIKGQISHPLLKKTLTFPTGDSSDCSKPIVRGVYSVKLHWIRDNYLC